MTCEVCDTEFEGKGFKCGYGHTGFCSYDCAVECFNEDNLKYTEPVERASKIE